MSGFSNEMVKNGKRIAIVAGLRTPFVRQSTVFQDTPAMELGKMLVAELFQRTEIKPSQIEQLVFGQVIQMPAVPNIAREIVLGTGMSVTTDAYSVTRACATSFQSVVNVAQSILLGNIRVGIAGGADSASVLPVGISHALTSRLLAFNKAKTVREKLALLRGLSWKDLVPVPPAVAEYTTGLTMGQTAEQMAKTYGITRSAQDAFAHRSHQNAANAWSKGLINAEVMCALVSPAFTPVLQDNTFRADSKLSSYRKLPPIFDRQHGSVTAGNSSPLTDGAAALVLMREDHALALGYTPLGFIRAFAFSAIDVQQDMLLGPAYATAKVLQQAGMSLADMSLIEMHEAFSAQVLANLAVFESERFAQDKLGLKQAIGPIDMDKLNVLGGSIAYGHPFAATGARMMLQSLNELNRRGGGLALNTACAAGGLGAAMILEGV